ncbi:hypothetical protein phiCbK_184 [Caulobacter phage phiCbK]|uniref:DUF7831 domain-containing protein n=5 Tax=Viruses TaxID=10239 RepID=K4JTA2_9CAUD|nr:hypothetical protein D865_gp282 [Caulobacter phage phiCbK]AFO71699.1 hypothetical protein phiCbK_184 [Caulobacter phage phiCbK]AFU86968.1 hypothetical protein CbK_gp136 [Caulobacter phage phiCbK]ARB15050.1 hypothetical protein Ccr32_gp132 [Caulobacter phage Ccr32]ARB15383.1 hypothetical protein Ccr34_gp141 [Caulobacter phage Ccr34]
MPLIYQHRIFREDLRRNSDVLYVFGDNMIRKGMGGQAGHMRGEPNAVGVATKRTPGMHDTDFFGDDPVAVDAQCRTIDEDFRRLFAHVKKGGIVVWPSDGIGTGLSELPTRSPATMTYIEQKLIALHRVAELHKRGELDRMDRELAPHL